MSMKRHKPIKKIQVETIRYKPLREKIQVETDIEEGVRDYVSGKWVKTGIKEHKEAVNIFSQKLVEELGYSKDQIQTIPQFRVKVSPSGQEKYPVDIAVFRDSRKSYDNVYMLVECKQPNRKDGKKQLDIYLNLVPSVEIGVWFNGKEHLYLWKVQDPKTKRWIWKEIPALPKKGQRVQDIGLYKRKDLEKPKNLKQVFNDIRNHLAGMTTGITRDEAIAQEIINLLFCKIYDELNTPPEEQVRFRAGVEEHPNQVKERILSLFNEVLTEYDDVFDEGDRIRLDAESIVYVVGELQRFAITEAERDAIGDAFEVFIGPALRGTEGQFFTPRNVVKMAIEILDPEPGEYIIDPACGSGGFLIVALEYVWEKLEEEARRKNWSKEYLAVRKREIASKFIAGIDKDSFLSKVTKAYMAIIGDGRGGIFCENSLLPPSEWNSKTRQKIELGKFDVLITNPPFGAKIPVRGERILSQYDLGFKWKFDKEKKEWERTNKLRDKQPPQILFIERCLQLLKPGGRMGIVLPDGILGNITDGYIRKFILDKAKILAVIDLPSETFQPSTSTKTSLIFLQKKKEDDKISDYPIFMAVAEKCGHDRRGKPIEDDDFPEISLNYRTYINNKNIDNKKSIDRKGFIMKLRQILESDNILAPRYFNPEIKKELTNLEKSGKYELVSFGELIKKGIISVKRGHEIGSKNYGSGDIPFVRTSDISNWEIRINKETSVDEETYLEYKDKQDLKELDVLFVNDGGRMIGEAAILTKYDTRIIIQSHIKRIRILKENDLIDPYLLLYLLKMPIVQKQIYSKVFVQATIPTLSNRLKEVILPIPRDKEERKKISNFVKGIIDKRSEAKRELYEFLNKMIGN
jgi:type I restriction enzyme M protein